MDSTSTIMEALARTPSSRKLSKEEQSKVDKLILDYIIAEARPITTVSSSSFKSLVRGLQPKASVMSYRKICRLLAAEYRQFQAELKTCFSAVDAICLTADMWSSRHRSFLGITAHWIVEIDDELLRKSAAVGFIRFKGIIIQIRLASKNVT